MAASFDFFCREEHERDASWTLYHLMVTGQQQQQPPPQQQQSQVPSAGNADLHLPGIFEDIPITPNHVHLDFDLFDEQIGAEDTLGGGLPGA